MHSAGSEGSQEARLGDQPQEVAVIPSGSDIWGQWEPQRPSKPIAEDMKEAPFCWGAGLLGEEVMGTQES